GIAVNTITLFLLHGIARVPLLVASALAVEMAVLHNYLGNEVWTFRCRPSVRRFAKFNLTALGALLVNVGAVQTLVAIGAFYLIANLVGIATAFAINLAISTTWIWGDTTNGDRAAHRTRGGVAAAFRSWHAHPLFDDLHLESAGNASADQSTGETRS